MLFAVLLISGWMPWREERMTDVPPVNTFVFMYSGRKTN
jgi:hypothetical protein